MEKTLVVVPTYNEIENIALLIPAIRSALPGAHVLVVDDSSPDNTGQAVTQKNNGIFLLTRPKKEGLGRAYVAGFKWALERDYELIFEMDADFSHDPHALPLFIQEIKDQDMIIGSRYQKGVNVINWPMGRLLLSWTANMVFSRLIAGMPLTDSTGGFKCFRRKVLDAIHLDSISSSGYSFQIESNFLAWKHGFRIKEIPIIFTDRRRGTSKMSSAIVREALLLLWKLRIRSFFGRF